MQKNFSGCQLVKFKPVPNIETELTEFLDTYFTVSALNYTDDGKEEYVGYATVDFSPEDLQSAAQAADIILPEFQIERLEEKNWLTENVIKFDPIETDDFCIYGVHEKQAPYSRKHLLKIYAATAFGSGHQTTKSCLNALSLLYHQGFNPQKILDMGTGSGILALACASLWKSKNPEIVAVDIDDEAVRVASQNAFDNHLEDYLHIAVSDGYASDFVSKKAPYDLIAANILARPLIEMAPCLSQSLKQGGYAVLSGFVEDQVDWVVNAHQEQGLRPVNIFNIDNWYAVLMEKL